jgi:hypothetical protein
MTAYTLLSAYSAPNANNAGANLTLTTLFTVSEAVPLTGIWFDSPSGAGGLPDACCIYTVSTQAQLSGTLKNSPTWSGAAGSGRIKCSYSGSVILAAGVSYLVAVHLPSSVADGYGKVAGFWASGAGASGLSSGPLSAPSYASNSLQGNVQSGSGTIAYPTVGESGAWYGTDVEVTPASGATLLMATGLL